jgi:heme exporter protein C
MTDVTARRGADDVPPIPKPRGWLGVVALVVIAAAQWYAISISPPDRDMGNLEKILYVHVPAAWTAFIAFFVVLVASAMYLWKREERYDLVAASAAEAGAVLTALTLALGSIWGRPTWGTWWTWDARLTSTAVLLLIYIGYLALRAATDDVERRARWSAAVGILGAINVPIVYMSVRWWRTLHQPQSSPATVAGPYATGLRLNALAMTLVLIWFILARYRAAVLQRAAEAAAENAALGGRA